MAGDELQEALVPSMSTGCAVHGEQEGAMLGISLVTLVSGAVDVAELVGRIQGMLEDSHCQGVWEAAGYLGQAEAQAVLLLGTWGSRCPCCACSLDFSCHRWLR